MNPEALAESGGKPVKLGDKNSRHKGTVKQTKRILDARSLSHEFTLAKNGVAFVPFPTQVENHRDPDQCRAVLYPAVEDLCKRLVGGSVAVIYNHNTRSEDPAAEAKIYGDNPFSHSYARFAHTDGVDAALVDGGGSAEYCRKKLSRELNLSEEETSEERMDVVMLGVWKAFDRPIQQNPLCILDGASISPDDVKPFDYTGNENGKNGPGASLILHNPRHRWLYWPLMQVDEALVFKHYDTSPGVAKYAFHTSFDDPTALKDAEGRRSIEFRVIVGIPRGNNEGAGSQSTAAKL